MLVKLKFEPVSGPAPPNTPLVGLRTDQPFTVLVTIIAHKLGIADFTPYAIYTLPDGPLGEPGPAIPMDTVLADLGLKPTSMLLVRPKAAAAATTLAHAAASASASAPAATGASTGNGSPPSTPRGERQPTPSIADDDSSSRDRRHSTSSDHSARRSSDPRASLKSFSVDIDPSAVLRHSELEEQVEEQVFTSEGAGEMHPLAVVKCTVTVNKKKRGDMIAVVRDWCGAFALFTITSSGLLGQKKLAITDAYPLVHQFQVSETLPSASASAGSTSSSSVASQGFALLIDDQLFEVECGVEQKRQLYAALKVAYDTMYEGRDKNEVILMRMATVAFSLAFRDTASIGSSDIDKALVSAFASGKLETFVQLRRVLVSAATRDRAISRILNYVDSKSLSGTRVQITLQCLKQCVLTPIKHESDQLSQITTSLMRVHGDSQLPSEYSEIAASLLGDFRVCYEVAEQWQGREAQPDIPFPEQYFGTQVAVEARLKRRETQAQSRTSYRAGVYIASLVLTSNDDLVVDQHGNLPASFVGEHSACGNLASESSEEFMWLLQAGKLVTSMSLPAREAELYPFRSAVLNAARSLANTLGVSQLGNLFGRPIVLPVTNTVLLCFVSLVSEQRPLRGSDGLSWAHMRNFEHKFYMKYTEVSVQARLELLSASFSDGPRFIQAMRDFAHQSTAIRGGVYVAHLRSCSTLNGFRVLVRNDGSHFVVPMERVADSMTDDDWAWCQGLAYREAHDIDLLDEAHTLSTKLSFQQRFLQAQRKLLDDLAAPSVGVVFDIEHVYLDEANSIRVIVCTTFANNTDLDRNLARRVEWRPLERVEASMFSMFCSKRSSEFLATLRSVEVALKDLAERSRTANDALSRQRERDLRAQREVLTLAWSPMRWVARAVVWSNKRVPPITLAVQVAPGTTVDAAVAVARRNMSMTMETARNSIVANLQTETWSDVVSRLDVLSLQDDSAADTPLAPSREPQLQPPSDVAPLLEGYDELAVDFSLSQLLPADRPWSPTPHEICYFITQEIVEEALVDAVDGAQFAEVGRVVMDMIDVLEAVDDLVEDVVIEVQRAETEARIDRDRADFLSRLDELFDPKRIPYDDKVSSADEGALDAADTTVVGKRVRVFVNDFHNTITMIDKLMGIVDTVLDLQPAVDTVLELTHAAERRARRLTGTVSPTLQSSARRSHDAGRTVSPPNVRLSLKQVISGSPAQRSASAASGRASAVRQSAASVASSASSAAAKPRKPAVPKFSGRHDAAPAKRLMQVLGERAADHAVEQSRIDADIRAAARRANQPPRPGRVTRAPSSAPPRGRQRSGTLIAQVSNLLPAGSPCRSSIKQLRSLNALYRRTGANRSRDDTESQASSVDQSAAARQQTAPAGSLASADGLDGAPFDDDVDGLGAADAGALADIDADFLDACPHVYFVSGDYRRRLDVDSARQCSVCVERNVSEFVTEDVERKPCNVPVFVFPIDADVLEICARFLEGPDSLPPAEQLLGDSALDVLRAADLLETPLLFIYCAGFLFDRHLLGVDELRESIASSFFLDLQPDEWHHLEAELSVSLPVFDFFWFVRLGTEFNTSAAFEAHRGRWKQRYCETRVENFLCAGAENVDEDELQMWNEFAGPLVRNIDVSESKFGIGELSLLGDVMSATLESLDASSSQVDDSATSILTASFPRLRAVALRSTHASDALALYLVSHVPSLQRLDMRDTPFSQSAADRITAARPSIELLHGPLGAQQQPQPQQRGDSASRASAAASASS